MEIIIGRDQQTRQLSITKDGQTKPYGQTGSVPMDVSRHHISLQSAGNGKWIIKNLNERNVTFVNGIAIESKTISESDKVELGNSHYLFPWAALQDHRYSSLATRLGRVQSGKYPYSQAAEEHWLVGKHSDGLYNAWRTDSRCWPRRNTRCCLFLYRHCPYDYALWLLSTFQ